VYLIQLCLLSVSVAIFLIGDIGSFKTKILDKIAFVLNLNITSLFRLERWLI